jgi:hypothetical protein
MPAANGSVQLAKIAAQLKATGQRDLRLQMMRGLREGAKPLIPAVREAATEQLPKAGGLNKQVAGQKITVSIRTGARTAGVRLTTTAPDTKQTDSGFVRHPTFGRRSKGQWRTQQIPAATGWWSKTLGDSAGKVTPELAKVMLEIAAAINGRA